MQEYISSEISKSKELHGGRKDRDRNMGLGVAIYTSTREAGFNATAELI